MTGYYRLALATYVVFFHLGVGFIFAGQLAVFSFYTLSGYLITLVLNDVYKRRTLSFFLNRAIRLYPVYWVCLFISWLIVCFFSLGNGSLINPALKLPSSVSEWVANIVVFGLKGEEVRLLPPAWSLNTELVYYLLMGLGLSRSKALTILWFIVSVIIAISAFSYPWARAYFSFIYPSLAFSSGAVLYYIKGHLSKEIDLKSAWALYVIGFLAPIFPAMVSSFLSVDLLAMFGATHLLFLAPFFSCALIIGSNKINVVSKRASHVCGDMAYPLFLIHWPVGAMLSNLFFNGVKSSNSLAISTLLLSLGFSFLISVFIEPQIKRLRNKVRTPTN